MRTVPSMSLLPMVLVAGCVSRPTVPPAEDPRWQALTSAAGAFRLDVTGAPDRAGDFVYLLKVPAALAVPPHTHNGALTARVRSGLQVITILSADGRREVHTLKPGQSYRIEAGALHEERFPEATITELRGRGPLRTERPQP